jgi:hypothetical protein
VATLAATRFDIDPVRVQLARLARWRRSPLARRTAALGTALAMHLAVLATILSLGAPQPAAKEVSAEAADGMVVGLVRLDAAQAHARAQAAEPAAQPPSSPSAPLTDQTPTAADPAPATPPSPPAASSVATAAEGELAVADQGTPQAGAVSPNRTCLHSGADGPNPSDLIPRPAATQPGRLSVGPCRSVG